MARVRSGDDAAETLVFRRYVERLIALAARADRQRIVKSRRSSSRHRITQSNVRGNRQ
jgi:hypothetical protein